MSFTYWVYDEASVNPFDGAEAASTHGYVGVSEDPPTRFRALKTAGTVPQHASLEILLKGPRAECLRLERRLRPKRGIGWNKARGGVAPNPWKHGYRPLSPDHFEGIWKD